MKDLAKTKKQLIAELQQLREQVTEQKLGPGCNKAATLAGATASECTLGVCDTAMATAADERQREACDAVPDAHDLVLDIFNGTSDLLAALDRDFRYLAFNRAYQEDFERIFGSSIEIGMSMKEALAHVPQDQATAVALWERALQGEQFTVTEELGDERRERHCYEINYSPIYNGSGHQIGAWYIGRNITERKRAEEALRESEERFRTLANSAPVLIWVNGVNGCEFVNSSYLQFLGLASDTDVRGYKWAEFIHPEDRDGYVTAYRTSFECQALFEAQCRFRRHDGVYRWMKSIGQPRVTPAREFLGYVGSTIDISDIKQAEEALCKLNEILERRIKHRTGALKKSREQFRQLSNELMQAHENERKRVANEIHDNAGQVLTAVKYRVEGALLQMKKEPLNQNLEPIEQLVPMIQHCVEDMRRLQMELRPSMLDEMGLLATMRWFCRQFQITHPSIRVEQDITVQEPEVPEQLRIVIFRVLQEALSNAGKYSDAELVHLSLQKRNGTLTLRIEDNGQGFDVHEAQEVQAFHKGLGLSSMRERVQYSGGRLSIKSAPGHGTRIEARWPTKALV